MPAESAFRDGNLPDFELIETIRWEPAAGFVRLALHLARLEASAGELGFRCDREHISEALNAFRDPGRMLRVRLALAADGEVKCTAAPFQPLPADAVWRARIAATRLSSQDPLLRHKTSRRALYEAARAEYPPGEADEMILLNERDEVCEGTITTVFVDAGDGGPLLTPALECGLLAGVLRAELIEQGRAREAVISPVALKAARRVYAGNSLRGLIPVSL